MQTFSTFTGKQYLQMDIAGSFGLDNVSWQERLDWFEQHKDTLHEMIPQAKDPAMYFAGINAWESVLKGDSIGYPISFDATSSGLQILACLTGDRSAASLCNVVNTGHREDAYTSIYRHMVSQLGEAAKIDRKDAKSAIMTAFYGSKAEPKRVFGEGKLHTTFLETMELMAPACWELNEAFLSIWDGSAFSNDWVLPDNFHVHVKVMSSVTETVNFLHEPIEIHRQVNAPTKEGRSLGANTVHSIDGMIVREMTRRCSYDPKRIEDIGEWIVQENWGQQCETPDDCMVALLWEHYQASGYLSARILDHLHNENLGLVDYSVIRELIRSLPEKPFQILSIHDCFRCLPTYANDLRKQYNLQLHLVAKSNLLSFILSQLLKYKVTLGKLDPSLANDILDSDYALS